MNAPFPGTVVIYGPFFARTGFGILARGWATALHRAGVPVRIVPVDCNDPNMSGDLDDCDLYLLQSLKYTPLKTPVTAIFAYVPTYVWPKLTLPDPHRRILLTTFDSSAEAAPPPPRLTFIGNQMDQVWLANPTEEKAWIRGGLTPGKVRSFNWPHEWIDNTQLGAPVHRIRKPGEPFRFLHISLFLPRRRLDVLLRAFFQEFKDHEAELVLKMAYPTWHPVPGKPRKDLHALIEQQRRETGSRLNVIVDESLGTRLQLARLIDSCDAYVSPDTTHTAPVTEAIVRERPVIITDGWGVDLPPQAVVVPNSARRVPLTAEMADYMPHQRGTSFPALDVSLVRQALRRVMALADGERRELVGAAARYMRDRYSYAATVPAAIAALQQVWETKPAAQAVEPAVPRRTVALESATARDKDCATKSAAANSLRISWCGLQLFHGKIPVANRQICLELMRRGHRLSLVPGNGPFHIEELDLDGSPDWRELARHFYEPFQGPADFNVSFRWHPVFGEAPAARRIIANTWWSGAVPTDWVKPIGESTDEVWVPSRFVRDHFLQGGVSPNQVRIIPFGIAPDVFRPGLEPLPLRTKKRFKFLFVGETSPRKGLDLLLNAYLRTFTRKDDVCLVIKDMNCEDYYARLYARELIQKCQAEPRAPEIEYLTTMLPEADLARLYAACDCFVQPHRAASFGLAILEAMACGVPVITTGFGGVLDFCDARTASLVPAREVRRPAGIVGHWRVSGEQVHAEVSQRALQEEMERAFQRPGEATQRARQAAERVRAEFSWARTVDRIEERLRALQSAPAAERPRKGASVRSAPAAASVRSDSPTAIMVAPFYNRSGYGVAARSLAVALHGAGMKIRTVPVDEAEEGIDDCDMNWLRSLEKTPVSAPVVAIFLHVPNQAWLKLPLPPNSLRILFTTFDGSAQGNLPPAQWISVCREMNQVWLMTEKEAAAFVAAGLPESKIRLVKSPHPWIHNPLLPPPAFALASPDATAAPAAGRKFRFLCISMFLPRRRWDALIEAFLTEFRDAPESAELYLKVNYPAWHPVPGQPRRDLRELVESLRSRTGSPASVVIDESLDTRLGICRLIDSCDAYVSTDTSITAPVGEAFVRGKIAVIPDGFGIALPYCEAAYVIPVDPKLSAPMTEAMLAYQPHHRGRQMPLLRVEDVCRTLRAAFETPAAERAQKGQQASLVMECAYGAPTVVPAFLKALNAGLREKGEATITVASDTSRLSGIRLDWIGSFLDHGSLSHVNRELTRALPPVPGMKLRRVATGNDVPDAAGLWPALLNELSRTPSDDATITVRHAWPPDWRRPGHGALVVIQPWEFGSLPREWVEQSRNVDEFWVPSEYVRRVYVESGVPAEKVAVVPNGVDPETFHPQAAPRPLTTRKSFRFLFVGGTIGRKGPDVLLKAYLHAFTAADDVCLVIKDFGGKGVYTGQTFESQIRAAQAQPNAPEILYLDEELPPEALPGLYTACHCLVLPYRGEGFGLPVLEAMACGLPVIVTAGGATDDFVRDEFAYRIPAERRVFGREVSGMKLVGEGWLLEPDFVALAKCLKSLPAQAETARAKGRLAAEHARAGWTWTAAARCAAGRIQELAARIEARSSSAEPLMLRQEKPSAPAARPACARLGNLDEARTRFGQRDLPAAWKSAIAALAARPFHPEAFLLLAEIALAAGDSAAARQCAQKARAFAPEWKAPKQFLQKPLKGNSKPDWLQLSTLNSQLSTRLAVCVIARNEERFLEQCLKSVKDVASQIVVVDTGSTDRTVEIAKAAGAEVFHFEWCDDFSGARNAALERATGDWILVLDADEELPAAQRAALKADLETAGAIGLRLPLANAGQEDGFSFVPRLFRNAPGVFYHGRIHEQVFPSLIPLCKSWGLETRLGTTQLLHHGYSKEMVRDRNKIERNLRLLRLAVEETPDDANLLMNLGLELVRSGDLAAGLEKYRESFRLMSARPPVEVVPELREALLTQLTCHLYKVREHDEVIRVLGSPLAKNGGLTASLHFALGLAHFESKQFVEAAEQMRRCIARRKETALSPINTDIGTSAPNHCLALSLAQCGDAAGAQQAFEAALSEKGRVDEVKLDYAKFLAGKNPVDALHKLHEIVARNEKHAGAWRVGGEIALQRADFLEFACDWTGEAIHFLPDDLIIVAQRAEALLLSQKTATAKTLWERACNGARPPRALAALILCAAVESQPVPETRGAAEETAASRAFVEWYQRLINAGARDTIVRLNARVEALKASLPTAAGLLASAMAEVNQAAAAT